MSTDGFVYFARSRDASYVPILPDVTIEEHFENVPLFDRTEFQSRNRTDGGLHLFQRTRMHRTNFLARRLNLSVGEYIHIPYGGQLEIYAA